MTTDTVSHQTALDAYLLTHAKSLIRYAANDELFAESLAALVSRLPETPGRYHTETDNARGITIPLDQEHAVTIATWLLEELQQQPTRTRHTTALLQTWAEPYQAPKDQIFGIIGIAIIGPTLGLIKRSKKKKKSALQVIVNETWQKEHSLAELLDLIQRVSQGVIAQELSLVGGNVYRLHPDSAEWCLSNPKTKLHTGKTDELKLILEAAKTERFSHCIHTSNETLIAIALSPNVNENFTNDFALEETV